MAYGIQCQDNEKIQNQSEIVHFFEANSIQYHAENDAKASICKRDHISHYKGQIFIIVIELHAIILEIHHDEIPPT